MLWIPPNYQPLIFIIIRLNVFFTVDNVYAWCQPFKSDTEFNFGTNFLTVYGEYVYDTIFIWRYAADVCRNACTCKNAVTYQGFIIPCISASVGYYPCCTCTRLGTRKDSQLVAR